MVSPPRPYDEKIVAFGRNLSLATGATDIELARFNWDDGSLDTTYGANGFVTTDFSGNDYGSGGVLLAGGKAVAVGTSGPGDFAVARYLGDPAPTVPTAPDLVVASDTGSSSADNNTKDTTPSFTGTCVTGETMMFKIGGADTTPQTRLLCRGATYSVTVPAALTDGMRQFSMVAMNGAGSSAAGTSLTVVIDNAVVAPVITSPAAGSSQSPTPTISGTSENGASVSVTNQANGSAVCTATANGSGVWSCVAAALSAGDQTVVATQTDLAGNTSSAVTRSFNVKAATTTTLTSSSNPSVYGQSVTFTATVASSSGTPGGTVKFLVDSEAAVDVTLSAGGTATLTRANLPVGAHSVTVVYNGDGNFNASAIASLTQTVNKADTTTVIITDTPDPSVVGEAVTFNYSVTSPSAGSLTGNVTISDGTNSCTASVTANSCTLTITTPATSSFIATYAGDDNFKTSSSSPSTQHTANKISTGIAITADTPCRQVAAKPLVVDQEVKSVSPSTSCPVSSSATPLHVSTTSSPFTYAATCNPISSPDSTSPSITC